MEMKQNMRLAQQQKLIMTPRLQQALKLLQLPTLELTQVLKNELLSNPVLEEVEDLTGPEERVEQGNEETPPPADGNAKIDWSEFFHNQYDGSYTRGTERSEEFYERVPVSVDSVQEQILEQLRLSDVAPEDRSIGEYLVGSLDEKGYLQVRLEDVAEVLRVPVDRVLAVLRKIQKFDPPGVGARDVRECLLLQLEADGRSGSLAAKILTDHYEPWLKRRYAEIARDLKVSIEDLQEATDQIARLNPNPGSTIAPDDVKYVYPDLIVERVGEDYEVYLNDKSVPRLRVSPAYENVLRGEDGNNETRTYVESKLNSARWLIRTIEQRRRTMVKVMKTIVEQQREFLDKGILHLKPLTLQQVANQIQMHESTVSRVTSDKYVQTPRGVFELKYFFTSGLETDNGDEVSAKTAKDLIQKMIDEEDRKRPLSDQEIADRLSKTGLRIARRTVAKYREALQIPNARYRKRH